MSLFERLSEEDKSKIHQYLCYYGDEGNGVISPNHLEYFLRFWETNKEPFFRAFGEQFILKKEVRLVKSDDELADEMYSALNGGHILVREFMSTYKEACRRIGNAMGDWDMQCRLKSFVDDWEMLAANAYTGPGFTIPGIFTKDGRPLVVNPNCKAVKMLGKIASALEVELPVMLCNDCGCYYTNEETECFHGHGKLIPSSGYELFRQVHSQVLNQKQIKGNLCLSIHPLDYITMSDNACGWDSCMRWMEEAGDYRLGTIEMMNSPYVIVAYVEAKEPMWIFPGNDWNNKRWRQLYIVTREVILGNRQYPYDSDDLQGIAIRWIRELMTQIPGYGPYPEETTQLKNNSWNTVRDKKIYFNFYTSYMYNDVYDYRLAYVADQKTEDDEYYNCCFSGSAVCTGCGDIIELDTVDANRVQCRACDGHWRCDFCGDWHSSYDESYSVDDEYLACDWCYYNELDVCEVCGDHHRNDNIEHIYLQFTDTENEEIKDGFNYNFYVSVCASCLNEPEEYVPLFGPLYEVKDSWGNTRQAFDVRNVTDAGFNAGNLSYRTIEWLKLMQAAKSDEERIDLLEKIVY